MAAPDPSHITLASQLLGAIPVAVGGAIGILAGLSAARYGGKLTEAREYRKERREKLETLVRAAFELDVWLKREENWILFKGPENLEVCPLAIVETIAALHFASLAEEAEVLASSVRAYRLWLRNGRAEMTAQNLATVSQAHLNTITAVYDPFLTARRELIAKAKAEFPGIMGVLPLEKSTTYRHAAERAKPAPPDAKT